MTVVAIWNPASGSAPEEDDLKAALGADVELVETTEEDPGPGQARAAVDAGAEVLVACGGDGTVRACLEPLANTDTSLAIVPLGTGNLLASNLGIPSGLDACSGIGKGLDRRVDLGRVNNETFAVMAGSGFDALMIRDASDSLKSKLGTVAYVWSGLKNLRTDVVYTEVNVDGENWFSGRTSLVLVGNFGTISGGIQVFPDAEPDDGLLDVAIMTANTLRDWVRIGARILRGKPPSLDLARRTKGRSVIVTLAEPRPYELDGEDRPATSTLEFEVQPDALSIRHESEE